MLKGSSSNISFNMLRSELSSVHHAYNNIGKIFKNDWQEFGIKGDMDTTPLLVQPLEYYMTDAISRHSKNMAACIARRDEL